MKETAEFIEELDEIFLALERKGYTAKLSRQEEAVNHVYGTIGAVEGDGLEGFWISWDSPDKVLESFRMVGEESVANAIEQSRWSVEVLNRGVDDVGLYRFTEDEDNRFRVIEAKVMELFIGVPTRLLKYAKDNSITCGLSTYQSHTEEGLRSMQQGQHDHALNAFERALAAAVSPDETASAKLRIGSVLMNHRQFAKARETLDSVQNLNVELETKAEALRMVAWSWKNEGNIEQAKRTLLSLLEWGDALTTSVLCEVLMEIGQDLIDEGELERGRVLLSRCLERNLCNPVELAEVHFSIGCSYMSEGQIAPAIDAFRMVLELPGANNYHKHQAVQNLKRLQRQSDC
jgi:tetratricopeptide (TPR) repeat protein